MWRAIVGDDVMRLYLAGESALELIRYLRSTNDDGRLGGEPVRRKTLGDAICRAADVKSLDETATRWLEHVSAPIHAFVGDRAQCTRTKALVTHVLDGGMRGGLFLDLGHDICISTPQFVFMQIAEKISLVETLRIGMELCGHYSRWRMEPRVLGDGYYKEYEENRACTFLLPAAMRVQGVVAFLEGMKGRRGAVKARAAAKWLLDESASPMETATYLLLCLPRRVGGYGLPKPMLNPKLVVKGPTGESERYPDLYWKSHNIDVEYNSDSAHSGEWARYRDSKREVELVVANVKVLPLTRNQLFDEDDFNAFAQGLRKLLAVRRRELDAGWEACRNELREALLPSWRPKR